jgi:fumarate reductase flavoprotein subunit
LAEVEVMTVQQQLQSILKRRIDIIIIGGGGAGLSAAVAAAEKNKTVVVLEKRCVAGGNAVMAGGIFAADSPAQKRQRIDASRDAFFNTAMGHAHWKVDPRILRTFIDRSGDTIQWLEAKGLHFEVPTFYANLPRTAHMAEGHGAGVVQALMRSCNALGVIFLYETAAEEILVDAHNRIEGVIAVSQGQQEKINSHNVIIATGGYAGNRDMLKKHYPFYSEGLHAIGLPHAGDGVRMALEIGAADEGLGNLHLRGPYFQGAMECVVAGMQPTAIWINQNGERYIDEGKAFLWPEAANALNRQPQCISFTLFDEALKESFIQEGVILGYNRFRQNAQLAQLDQALGKEIALGRAAKSQSIGKLSEFVGSSAQVLESTIADYNAACRLGCDSLFLKDKQFLKPMNQPPFYALKCYQSFFATIGGIKIDQRMRVLNTAGNNIHGLYAAGNDTGGWETDTYCLALPGMALGFAIVSGRIAGENAAGS